mmetsp:Transcript_12207/g.23345  ORF Transcript_12207/g.23345 Transcript_12207/m.23345 type:complete len:232 (+) Transcript_12207:10445-11140(+)
MQQSSEFCLPLLTMADQRSLQERTVNSNETDIVGLVFSLNISLLILVATDLKIKVSKRTFAVGVPTNESVLVSIPQGLITIIVRDNLPKVTGYMSGALEDCCHYLENPIIFADNVIEATLFPALSCSSNPSHCCNLHCLFGILPFFAFELNPWLLKGVRSENFRQTRNNLNCSHGRFRHVLDHFSQTSHRRSELNLALDLIKNHVDFKQRMRLTFRTHFGVTVDCLGQLLQ